MRSTLFALVALVLLAMGGCTRSNGNPKSSAAEGRSAQPETPAATVPDPGGTAPRVDAQRAMKYVREVVAFGPRPIGSPAHKKLEGYILAQLKGDQVESDEFTAQTPAGAFPMRNIIAKYPGKKDGIIVIGSHYDTLYGRPDFVGANDGGATTGLLLELGHHLRGKREGYSVWLVWFDGEEAVRHWSPEDSVYGSRHLAEKWQKDGTLKKIKAFLLTDMIGDAELDIQRDENSTAGLEDLVYKAASNLGYQSHFFATDTAVEDDHLPFKRAGVPVADIIDIDYGYGNALHHTDQDTLDKLSPKSLKIAGDVVLETVRLLDQR
ncbi:MAG TPA: M28 family peptidase [Terriglobales bacterium]|nr:M28 family peptidase [Terriglobales bacterium]